MISSFVSSRLSGYIAIISIISILGLVWYIYKEGKNACVGAVATETIKLDQQSRKDSYEAHKEIQGMDELTLNSKLCSLGIVRQSSGCK